MVQPDAWDRYGERATLCFGSKTQTGLGGARLERVVRGPIGVIRGGSGLSRSYSYSLTAIRGLVTAQHTCQ